MAKRPAWTIENGKIISKDFEFAWNGGFAISQKRKNINALHQAIEDATGQTALEISSKGEVELGNQLSAFKMKTTGVFIENVFQASKRYENGGPYLDLLDVAPKDAKRDERHKISGKLVAFVRNGEDWPLEPKTVFYDYIYVLHGGGLYHKKRPSRTGRPFSLFRAGLTPPACSRRRSRP